MSKRRKNSALDAWTDLIALLPWWAGVLLAVLSYGLLHHQATRPLPMVTQPAEVAHLAGRTMWLAVATFGQYLAPVVCLVGALSSFLAGRKRRRLFDQAADHSAPEVLNAMSWREFETLVGEAFRRQGYRVMETGGGGPDGGVDLVLSRAGETILVQCKQWRALKVGVSVVRELYGVMAAQGAAGGVVVTSGRFTEDAQAFAQGRHLRLLDGPQLHALIRLARQVPAAPQDRPQSSRPAAPAPGSQSAASPPSAPGCPRCGQAMVLRTAQRGAHPGRQFWGCRGYPSCRGTQPVL